MPNTRYDNKGGATTATAAATVGRNCKYKMAPPRFAGECTAFEEWKHETAAYLALQDSAQLQVTNGHATDQRHPGRLREE